MQEYYNMRECDYNEKKAQELYANKTVEELDKEWEAFKQDFIKKHKQPSE